MISQAVELLFIIFSFFFNQTATTEIYTLSLHDALPICEPRRSSRIASSFWTSDPTTLEPAGKRAGATNMETSSRWQDRKSTRLNSSHSQISYAVFCLKKKTTKRLLRLSTKYSYNPSFNH